MTLLIISVNCLYRKQFRCRGLHTSKWSNGTLHTSPIPGSAGIEKRKKNAGKLQNTFLSIWTFRSKRTSRYAINDAQIEYGQLRRFHFDETEHIYVECPILAQCNETPMQIHDAWKIWNKRERERKKNRNFQKLFLPKIEFKIPYFFEFQSFQWIAWEMVNLNRPMVNRNVAPNRIERLVLIATNVAALAFGSCTHSQLLVSRTDHLWNGPPKQLVDFLRYDFPPAIWSFYLHVTLNWFVFVSDTILVAIGRGRCHSLSLIYARLGNHTVANPLANTR